MEGKGPVCRPDLGRPGGDRERARRITGFVTWTVD